MPSRLDSLRADVPGFRLGILVAFAFGIHLIAAWYNGGFLNADEHYQIIEFAQYKLGRQSTSGLAWEFAATMRPALQPWIAAGAIRLGDALGVASPFAVAFALRVASIGLAMWMSLELCARALRTVTSPALKLVALGVSLFFWITPTVHARFSSENWGGALLVAGLCLMLDAADEWPTRPTRGAALAIGAGLAWSAAFYCRFQIGAAIAGAGLWLLVIRRARLSLLLLIASSFLLGCGLNEVLDHWLYGVWTLVPYNYFKVNLLQGKAATFGTSPWWMVPVYFAVVLIPPYSLVVLVLLAAACWSGRRDFLVWTIAPFVVLHAVIAHKEPRFLMPVLYFIGPLLALSIASLPRRLSGALGAWRQSLIWRASVVIACTVNVALLCIAISIPANDTFRLDRWLWERSQRADITLYALDQPPFHGPAPLTNSFYSNRHVTVSHVETAEELSAAARSGSPFVYYWGVEPPPVVTVVGTCAPLLRTFPVWLGQVSAFVTVLDVHLATVCRLEARPPQAPTLVPRPPRS